MGAIETIKKLVLANSTVPEEMKFKLDLAVEPNADKERIIAKLLNGEYENKKAEFRKDIEAAGMDLSFATLAGAKASMRNNVIVKPAYSSGARSISSLPWIAI